MRMLDQVALGVLLASISVPLTDELSEARQRGRVQAGQYESERVVIEALQATLLPPGLDADVGVLFVQWQADPASLGHAGTHALISAMVLQLGEQQELSQLDVAGIRGIARIVASGADADDVMRLEHAWIAARASGNQPTGELAEMFMRVSSRNAVYSRVVFHTFRAGQEVGGASIKYESLKSREENRGEVLTAGVSETNADMLMSWYYVWAERDGVPTSDTGNLYAILSEEVPIEIEETSPYRRDHRKAP